MLYFPGFAAACLVTHVVLPAPGKPIIITTYDESSVFETLVLGFSLIHSLAQQAYWILWGDVGVLGVGKAVVLNRSQDPKNFLKLWNKNARSEVEESA